MVNQGTTTGLPGNTGRPPPAEEARSRLHWLIEMKQNRRLLACLVLLCVTLSGYLAGGSHTRSYNLTEAGVSNLTCFSCGLDFRYVPWDGDHPCLGWTGPVTTEYLVLCGAHQPTCQETWFVQNGVLLQLSRGCTDSCAAYCKSTGFGVTRTTCNLCCDEDGCNDHPPTLQATTTGL